MNARDILNSINTQWKKDRDPASALAGLGCPNAHGLNLALSILSTEVEEEASKKICLDLMIELAQYEKTNIKDLIALLDVVLLGNHVNAGECMAARYISKENTKLYLDLLHTLSNRQDITAEQMKELVSHHHITREGKEKSFCRNILNLNDAETLQKYLSVLVNLLHQGKLEKNTIWHALQTPGGEYINIGDLMTQRNCPAECILLLTQLLGTLQPKDSLQLLPKTYNNISINLKEKLHALIKTLPDAQQEEECMNALNPNHPLGYIMHLKRGGYECDETHGTLKEISATLGLLTRKLKLSNKPVTLVQTIAAPTPTAPPLSPYEEECLQIYNKLPPAEYLYIPPTSATDAAESVNKEDLNTDLVKAAMNGDLEKVKQLIQQHADVNAVGTKEWSVATPLYIASQNGHTEVVRALLDDQATINTARKNGMTPLCAAVVFGHTKTVALLLSSGANADIFTEQKNSPLALAASHGHAAVLDLLIEKLIRDVPANKLLDYLLQNHHFLRALQTTKHCECALALIKLVDHLQTQNVSKEAIKVLMPEKFTFATHTDLKDYIVDKIRSLPIKERLAMCEQALNPETTLGMILLLQRGPTPCQPGHGALARIARIINEAGAADKQKHDNANALVNDVPVLFNAIEKEDTDRAKQLILDGADVNDTRMYPPLCYAAQCGNIQIIQSLLENGADPHITFKITKTQLTETIVQDNTFKSDSNQRISDFLAICKDETIHLSAMKVAELFGHQDIVELVKSYQEKQIQPQDTLVAQPLSSAPVMPAPTLQPYDVMPVHYGPLTSATTVDAKEPPVPATQKIYPSLDALKESSKAIHLTPVFAVPVAASIPVTLPTQVIQTTTTVAQNAAPVNVMDLLFSTANISKTLDLPMQPMLTPALPVATPVINKPSATVGILFSFDSPPPVQLAPVKNDWTSLFHTPATIAEPVQVERRDAVEEPIHEMEMPDVPTRKLPTAAVEQAEDAPDKKKKIEKRVMVGLN